MYRKLSSVREKCGDRAQKMEWNVSAETEWHFLVEH